MFIFLLYDKEYESGKEIQDDTGYPHQIRLCAQIGGADAIPTRGQIGGLVAPKVIDRDEDEEQPHGTHGGNPNVHANVAQKEIPIQSGHFPDFLPRDSQYRTDPIEGTFIGQIQFIIIIIVMVVVVVVVFKNHVIVRSIPVIVVMEWCCWIARGGSGMMNDMESFLTTVHGG